MKNPLIDQNDLIDRNKKGSSASLWFRILPATDAKPLHFVSRALDPRKEGNKQPMTNIHSLVFIVGSYI